MVAFPRDTHSPEYLNQLTIYNNQHKQDNINKNAHDAYVLAAANWLAANIQNRNVGVAITPVPELPLMVIYNDDGTVTHQAFPDLGIPTLPPDISTGTPIGSTPPNIPLDRTDAILQLVNENNLLLKRLAIYFELP